MKQVALLAPVLSRADHDRLLPVAYQLAHFILQSDELAEQVAAEALALLPSFAGDARPGLPSYPQVLQQLVYERTQNHEVSRSPDDVLRYYLKELAHRCLLIDVFDACVAMNLFVYDLRGQDALNYFHVLTGHRLFSKNPSRVSDKKRETFQALAERFRGILLEDPAPTGSERHRFLYGEPVHPQRVAECLANLAPWQASGRLTRPADETSRIRTLFDVEAHRRLCADIDVQPNIRIPKLHL